jgi:cold shock CspA family protein
MTARRIALSLFTGLVFIGAAAADEARGRIVRIDPDKQELRLDCRGPLRGSLMSFKVADKTEILIGGQPAKLNDLAPGNRVRVVFEPGDKTPVAQSIRTLGLAQALGQPRPAARPGGAAPAPALKEGEGVSGVLQRVALTDAEIVVVGPGPKGPKTETTIAVPEEATILRDGKKITLDDLNEGEAVTIKTEMRKGKLTAVSIQVGEAAAAANPAMPPRRELIPRLRQALKMADELLRQMEEGGGPFPIAPNRPSDPARK